MTEEEILNALADLTKRIDALDAQLHPKCCCEEVEHQHFGEPGFASQYNTWSPDMCIFCVAHGQNRTKPVVWTAKVGSFGKIDRMDRWWCSKARMSYSSSDWPAHLLSCDFDEHRVFRKQDPRQWEVIRNGAFYGVKLPGGSYGPCAKDEQDAQRFVALLNSYVRKISDLEREQERCTCHHGKIG